MLDELRDPWAIALAITGAYSAWLVGGRDWQIVLVPISVLVARVVGGLLFPLPPVELPTRKLSPDEYIVARLIAQDPSTTQIAEQLKISEKAAQRMERRIMAKIGGTREDIKRWIGAPGTPEPPPRHWYERTIVRGTLAGAGLISLVWTVYNILKASFPELFPR